MSKIDSSLVIDSTSLTTLSGLNGLDSVKGYLRILGSPVLLGLVGLENLGYVGRASDDGFDERGLYIGGNPLLSSLHGLENLTAIGGGLEVFSNPSLTSLDGLGSLDFIGNCLHLDPEAGSKCRRRSISIHSNPALASLTGLNKTDTLLGGVSIVSNTSLKSLDGLNNLHFIIGYLNISSNDSLATLSGLENLGWLSNRLSIMGNPALTTLNALSKLGHIGACPVTDTKEWNLVVDGNSLLTSLAGLDSAQITGSGEMRILNCPLLATCDVHSICLYFQNWGLSNVSDNAPGCNSVAEVEAACIVSIDETSTGLPVITFSPNPVSDFLQIQVSDNEKWEISLYDLQGRLLYRQVVTGSQIIGVKDWHSGLYALRAVSGGRVFSGKIVKQ